MAPNTTHNAGQNIDVEEKQTSMTASPSNSDVGISKNLGDKDVALKILEERGESGPYVLDPAMRKRVLRKIDLRILPILT